MNAVRDLQAKAHVLIQGELMPISWVPMMAC